MKLDVAELQRVLGYTFNDPSLLEMALTHRSKGALNNERLEFLGDAILGFVVANALFACYRKASEGQLSRFRASLVKKETLAELAREFSLGDYLRLGSGEMKSGGYRRDSILADAMEAVFGAIFLDGGMSPVQQLIEHRLRERMAALSNEIDLKDPKTRLQEYLQARGLPLPNYQVVATSGDEHERRFDVRCTVECLEQAVAGSGTSRRRAEQSAAQAALERLGESRDG